MDLTRLERSAQQNFAAYAPALARSLYVLSSQLNANSNRTTDAAGILERATDMIRPFVIPNTNNSDLYESMKMSLLALQNQASRMIGTPVTEGELLPTSPSSFTSPERPLPCFRTTRQHQGDRLLWVGSTQSQDDGDRPKRDVRPVRRITGKMSSHGARASWRVPGLT